ncbi:site-specific integrase [Lysinibacillus xylanilyticus]|uniref:site-specific integrase n=1 Tax=Lysinibacillus xylanilyticus TaxID=582475 RepID=UPI00382D8D3D
MLKENLKELIDLDELAEEKFSIVDSVRNAKEILNVLQEEDAIFNAEFEDDIWTFDRQLLKTFIVFDFSKIRDSVKFRDYLDSATVDLIKCWVANNLSNSNPETVSSRFRYLKKIIEMTHFFKATKADEFIEYIRNYSPSIQKCLDHNNPFDLLEELKKERSGLAVVRDMISTSLNFLIFSDLQSFHVYYDPLLNIRNGLPSEVFARQLPSGKDVLKFDYCINRYFKSGINSPSRLYFCPILIWWKITNIIPMRISEFCNIKRKCISEKNGGYYITLPRHKKPVSKRRIQVVDTLEISKDIFDLIDKYIKLTNKFGESKTLASFRAYKMLYSILGYYKNGSGKNKINLNYFNRLNFASLLKRFYKEVVYEEYNKTVQREIKPNDTRHFAFCSLLMQGYSPIEIARLGGHTTVEAQYHYSNHTEFYIDFEVKKLIDGYMKKDGELRGAFEGQEVSYDDIEKKSLQFPNNNTRLPMDVGYCIDELQRCESEECMLCKNWWIHPVELIKAKPLIESKIRERRNKIVEMGCFLKNLNENFKANIISDVDPKQYTIMDTKAAFVKEHLEEIARLEMLIGVEVDE